jgi:hypothetical protein
MVCPAADAAGADLVSGFAERGAMPGEPPDMVRIDERHENETGVRAISAS